LRPPAKPRVETIQVTYIIMSHRLVDNQCSNNDSTTISVCKPLAQVEVLSSRDNKLDTAVLHLNSSLEPPSLPSCPPSKYTVRTWQTLRPYLRSRGYRLITQRDVAFEVAKALNEPIPDHWNGSPKDDDQLYSASLVCRSFVPPHPHLFFFPYEISL
jgi:hypothetical protein